MKGSEVIRDGLWPGALAGLFGGLVFGAAMSELGVLPTVASLVRADSAAVGFAVHMVIAALVGAGFGLLVWHQQVAAGETFFWGLTYGTLWWFLGPLTLMPLLLGGGLAWDVGSAREAFPSLLGHLLYGAATGLALVAIRRTWSGEGGRPRRGAVLRGALAGLLGAWLLGRMLQGQDRLMAFSTAMPVHTHRGAWLVLLATGVLAGAGFALLFPRRTDSSGVSLIRGTLYGFFWWVVGALTLMPLIGGAGLTWSLEAARANFATFPGYVLFGATLGLLYQWFAAMADLLFSDMIADPHQEGVGAEGLRAIGRGAVSGLMGGLIFTVVMVRVGFLPTVARLVGSTSPLTGFLAHLVIADLIGVSYGVLFRRQSYDIGSALGWGVAYGFFWWILGPLTLLPILLGAPPRWTVEVAAGLTASLVGHLAYGAAVGITFHRLEARYNPWWVPRSTAEAARAARRKQQVATSAPALWALVVTIALTLPVVLGR